MYLKLTLATDMREGISSYFNKAKSQVFASSTWETDQNENQQFLEEMSISSLASLIP